VPTTPGFEWDGTKARENLKKHERQTMKTPQRPRHDDDVGPEDQFDYSRAKPDRFASRTSRPVVAVVLEADVAAAQQRFAIASRKRREQTTRTRARHRRAS